MPEAKENDSSNEQVEDRLRTLVAQASKNDPDAVWPLREYLEEHPEVWQKASDLAGLAEDAQLSLVCGSENVLVRESLRLRLEAFRAELGEASASPIERVLIQRTALCWLQSHIADIIVAQNSAADDRQLAILHKRADRAQRNLLAAAKQLCLVRKLLAEAQAKPLQPPRRREKAVGVATGGAV